MARCSTEIPLLRDENNAIKDQIRTQTGKSYCKSCNAMLTTGNDTANNDIACVVRCPFCNAVSFPLKKATLAIDWTKAFINSSDYSTGEAIFDQREKNESNLQCHHIICGKIVHDYAELKKTHKLVVPFTYKQSAGVIKEVFKATETHLHSLMSMPKGGDHPPGKYGSSIQWFKMKNTQEDRVSFPTSAENSATKIQRVIRSFVMQRSVTQKNTNKKHLSSTMIQRHFRGSRIRSRLKKINSASFEYYDEELDMMFGVKEDGTNFISRHTSKNPPETNNWKPQRPAMSIDPPPRCLKTCTELKNDTIEKIALPCHKQQKDANNRLKSIQVPKDTRLFLPHQEDHLPILQQQAPPLDSSHQNTQQTAARQYLNKGPDESFTKKKHHADHLANSDIASEWGLSDIRLIKVSKFIMMA
uniref:Uncharacterized protein n=1 Tax=Ditylum brightwellii TaxID=49249 RepID=A0A7S4VD44_9STRA